jgi:nucleotide-binding universal stress UspA family protein
LRSEVSGRPFAGSSGGHPGLSSCAAPYSGGRAHRNHADLIVIGARGQRRLSFRELLLGSTAERVVRGANRPVLIARESRGSYRRPLVAMELAPASSAALEMAVGLTSPNGRLLAVHICEAPLERLLYRAESPRLAREYRRECVAEARVRLGELVAELPVHFALTVRSGDPRRGILDAARRTRADLIALGRGGSRLRHFVLGSVSEAVARAASCDVLVARS